MISEGFLALAMLGLVGTASPTDTARAKVPPKPAVGERQPARELRRRTLTIDDSNINSLPEIHVAGGGVTVLSFQVPVDSRSTFVSDTSGALDKPVTNDRFVLIRSKRDLPAPVALNVTLEDGTPLAFELVSSPKDADVQVDVIVALQKRAAADSAPALKTAMASLQAQLDDCQASTEKAGITRLATLMLQQNLDEPQAFERHTIHAGDKQGRLKVTAHWVYRMLGMTYVILTLQNRDPAKPWVFDRAEVKLVGDNSADVKVLATAVELTSIPTAASSKLVVAFKTPSQSTHETISLTLLEREGGRHVVLDGLNL